MPGFASAAALVMAATSSASPQGERCLDLPLSLQISVDEVIE
jgi:hypothetical protein